MTAEFTGREGEMFVLEAHLLEGTAVLVYQTVVSAEELSATFRTSGGTEWTATRTGNDWFYGPARITVLRDPADD